jgi:NADH-quinone oxidoreductase subunit M
MTLFAMASLGLPGLSGFVAEFMSFVGAFQTYPVLTAVGVIGVLLTAGYILRMIQRMFLGPFSTEKWGNLTEINGRELFTVAPLAVLTIWIGVYPKPLADLMSASVEAVRQLALR